jgi:hypothetical protein
MDTLQVGSRVNHIVLANKSRKKSKTLTDSVYAWKVCAAATDGPDREPSSVCLFQGSTFHYEIVL